jgi:hypothetical protein
MAPTRCDAAMSIADLAIRLHCGASTLLLARY